MDIFALQKQLPALEAEFKKGVAEMGALRQEIAAARVEFKEAVEKLATINDRVAMVENEVSWLKAEG